MVYLNSNNDYDPRDEELKKSIFPDPDSFPGNEPENDSENSNQEDDSDE